MKTSAGRRSDDDNRVSRRLRLVTTLCDVPERADRRFKIGFADNLFAKDPRLEEKQLSESLTEADSEPDSNPDPRPSDHPSMELVIGVTALAGLAIGYLIGKTRK